MADTISVKSKLPPVEGGGAPVALWEKDAAHPDGEAYVAGPDPVEVAETSGVNQAVSEGRIEKVGAEARREARQETREEPAAKK